MDIQEYHSQFKNTGMFEMIKKYGEFGMNSKNIAADSIFYCLRLSWLSDNILNATAKSTRGSGFHPGVTPKMATKFIIHATGSFYLEESILIRFTEYDQFNEVIQALLETRNYRIGRTSEGTHFIGECSPAYADILTNDELIFIADIYAKNGYANSIKYQVAIDYSSCNKGPITDECVDEYKRLCLESAKACW